MIAFKYTKTDGAQYLSHLDLLRHVYRTLRRARIPVEESCGYHAHARIFLNNPLPVGVESLAEYGTVDTTFCGDFKSLFNDNSPKGIKCLDFLEVNSNPNYANAIERCEYVAEGISPFDIGRILSRESIIITDMRGREVDIRTRIFALEQREGKTYFTLSSGANNLRPDLFVNFLCSSFGGEMKSIIKLAACGKGVF